MTATILLPEADRDGWRILEAAGLTLWIKGHIYSCAPRDLLHRLAAVDWTEDALSSLLAGLDGHFAIFVRNRDDWLASADRIRSIPVVYGLNGGGLKALSNSGDDLARRLMLGPADVSPVAAVSIAMSGYTVGADSLFAPLSLLTPGQFLLARDGHEAQVCRYDRYLPRRMAEMSPAELGRNLADSTLAVLEKMARSASGRQIVIPLSAGHDSRVIASGLKELGVRDVKCFSYGIDGNFEAAASRVIANHLGYEWTFVPTHSAAMRRLYRSEFMAWFFRFVDDGASVPMIQDLGVVRTLMEQKWIDRDSVIVNGNSGDFISGNHIPPALHGGAAEPALGAAERRARIAYALWKKHYQLWGSLTTAENRDLILQRLHRELAQLPLPERADEDFGLYEFLEFQDRQSKYVISGQRAYEYLGLDWRLPLWDCAYLDFWQQVPRPERIGQALYRRVMAERNWGGVWDIWPLNSKNVRPVWLRPARLACKMMMAPFGKVAWHRLERNVFSRWMDNIGTLQMFPYSRVALDRRGQRHSVSWLAEDYLGRKGLGYDGAAFRNN